MAQSGRTRPRLTSSWQLVQPSINLVKRNFEAVTIILLLPTLVTQLGSLLLSDSKHFDSRAQLGVAVLTVGLLWLLLNYPVSYYLQLQAASGKSLSVGQYYRRGLAYFWRIIFLNFAIGLLVLGGLILLIVPGLIMLRRYFLAPFYLLDNNLSIGEAMKRSAADSKQVGWYIWGIIGVTAAFSIAASLLAQAFKGIPGLDIIVSTLVSSLFYFGPALRYLEIKKTLSSS